MRNREKKEEAAVPDRIDYGKQEKAARLLKELLKDGPVRATEIRKAFFENNICEATMTTTKKILGVKSTRYGHEWFWIME